MNVLSIDWDFFFPDPSDYDWGANEEMAFMFEAVWHTRCNSRNIFNGEHVLDHFHPDVTPDFWKIVKGKPIRFLICESHAAITQLLNQLEGAVVTNIAGMSR